MSRERWVSGEGHVNLVSGPRGRRLGAPTTAFLDNFKGAITLKHMEVTAVVDGPLPNDSVHDLVSLR